jgi:hypothetical protein
MWKLILLFYYQELICISCRPFTTKCHIVCFLDRYYRIIVQYYFIKLIIISYTRDLCAVSGPDGSCLLIKGCLTIRDYEGCLRGTSDWVVRSRVHTSAYNSPIKERWTFIVIFWPVMSCCLLTCDVMLSSRSLQSSMFLRLHFSLEIEAANSS